MHKSGNKALIRKVEQLFTKLSEHPYTGTGQPEQMRYIQGMWSRRLDRKNRLRYTVNDLTVTVYTVSASGHYEDK
ncbi:MAG: Txe/YoeB family addiction module toxin [Tannerella sp.]|nr:Txe/YoeB family addiction module toxin [Tannerella sp.]